MENRKMVPEIRFSGFTDPWEQCKLEDFVDKAVDNRGKTPPLDECGSHPLIEVAALGGVHPNYSKIEKYLSDDSFENSLRAYIKKGDILFATVGSIGLVSLMDSRDEAAIAQNIVAFRAKENFVPEYLYALFTNEGNQYKAKRIVMGAVQPSIKVSQLVNVEYKLTTNNKEQKKIGMYFSCMDTLITLHQRKLEKLKTFKKAMLDKMFPKNGKLVPEIRFSGFTDPWEQRKFNEIAVTRRGLTYNPSDVCEDGIRVLRSSNIKEDTFVTSDDDVFVKKDAINIPYACDGDILITSANGSSHLVGKHAIIRQIHNNSAVIGGFMLLATTKNPQFLNASMGSSWYTKFINLSVAGGNGAIGNLSKNELDEKTLFVPSDVEQETIGHFFKNIDNLITLHQRKLEKLQNIKKSMLNKMFI